MLLEYIIAMKNALCAQTTVGRLVTSLPTKVRVFSDIFRDRKTKVAYFTSQFLNNYKLRPYIIQAHTIREARLSLEGVQIKF